MAAVPAHAAVLHGTLTRYLRLSNSDPLCQLRRPRSVVSLDRGHFFSLGLYLFMVSAPRFYYGKPRDSFVHGVAPTLAVRRSPKSRAN